MAASANPSGNNNNNTNNNNGSSTNNNGNGNGNGVGVVNGEVGPTQAALRHNPGLTVEWGPDEQSLLEELLTKYVFFKV